MIGRGRLSALAGAAALLAGMGGTMAERAKIPGRFTSPFERAAWDADIDYNIATRREALAGKPWKRGGRLTIRQRRGLAFAVRRM